MDRYLRVPLYTIVTSIETPRGYEGHWRLYEDCRLPRPCKEKFGEHGAAPVRGANV
jgi:hypothetical protein